MLKIYITNYVETLISKIKNSSVYGGVNNIHYFLPMIRFVNLLPSKKK